MREERYYIILVIVRGVFGLGASSPGAAQHPAIVFISTLEGRLEGVMVEERGEGVLVEAEAAPWHGLGYFCGILGCPNARASAVAGQGPSR